MKVLLLLCVFLNVSLVSLADQWIQRADLGGVGRHRAISIGIGNKVYMGTGHFNGTGIETYFSDWWEYDPASNSWSQKADYAGNSGNGELGAHGMELGTFGFVGLGELDKHSLFKYDPVTNTWTEVTGPLTNTNFQDTGSFTIGHKGYFMNLFDGQIHMYDADLDAWILKNFVPFPAYFSYSGFSIGGIGYMKVNDALWEYDPIMDVWTLNSMFPGLAKLSSMSFVQNEKAYIICGYNSIHADLVSEVWEFDPSANLWTQQADFPGAKRRYSCGVAIGNRAFVGTGTNGTNFNDFWEFNAVAEINELETDGSFTIYPNPTKDFIEIHSENQSKFEVDLFDLSGRKMKTGMSFNGQTTIDCIDLLPGSYFYKIGLSGALFQSGKILVQ